MIYYVEDDANIRDLAVYGLDQAGFEARGFSCAEEFFAACREALPDAVLLDIMLPDTDGLEILARLRADGRLSGVPVMMVTAKGTELDTVLGLDAGADDYLAKPFGMMELVSRVRALMRRAQSPAFGGEGHYRCGPIELDAAAHEVRADGALVALTPKEFDTLRMLMANEGRVLSRSQLLEAVWGWAFAGQTRTVDVHIQTLRQKLAAADPAAAEAIETIRGVGYVLKA